MGFLVTFGVFLYGSIVALGKDLMGEGSKDRGRKLGGHIFVLERGK